MIINTACRDGRRPSPQQKAPPSCWKNRANTGEQKKHPRKWERRRKKNPAATFLAATGLTYAPATANAATPQDLLHYVYAALHSPAYRQKYRALLKTDFPRIPIPPAARRFRQLASIGARLRALHLLQNVPDNTLAYPIAGDNIVRQPHHKNDRVYINATQYFAPVPAAVWNQQIGGYAPAQKYLKDRKNQPLPFAHLARYQQIIAALSQTQTLTATIDD